jgi:hypothetical protein
MVVSNIPIIGSYILYWTVVTGPPRGGGQGGQIAPGHQVLGAPRNFLLGPSHFFGSNISAQRARYLFLGAKYRKLV